MSEARKKVALIDDDNMLRETYRLIINSHQSFCVACSFSNIEDALKHFERELPDIIMADIELPGKSGIDGVKVIKSRWPYVEVIMLTIYQDDDLVLEALKAGASGYITKGTNYIELLQALEELLRGGAPMSSAIARKLISGYHINLQSPLTKREREILSKLSVGKTYSQIAEELFISKDTSRTHIRNIYFKLQVSSKSEAIEKATKQRFI